MTNYLLESSVVLTKKKKKEKRKKESKVVVMITIKYYKGNFINVPIMSTHQLLYKKKKKN